LHVVLVILVLPAFVIASDALARLLIGLFGPGNTAAHEKLLREVFLPFPWWFAVLAVGICPGVVEELWCRGFLGRGLVGRYGWPIGIILTSTLFGLLHVFPVWYVLITASMGVGLHLVYLASRSLWVPILLHTLNNSLSALGSIRAIPLERLERNAGDAPYLVLLLGAGLLVFVGVAMTTARVRLVPADSSLPAWEPPFPGVAHPPPGVNAVFRSGSVSPAAFMFSIVTFLALMLLLFR
jgi:membrane protease YdiL (CAAX protease family)